jgi:hypothetical protein
MSSVGRMTLSLAVACASFVLMACGQPAVTAAESLDGGPMQTLDVTTPDAGWDAMEESWPGDASTPPPDGPDGSPTPCAPSPEIHGNLEPLWTMTLGSGRIAAVVTDSSSNILVAGLAGDVNGAGIRVGSQTLTLDAGDVPSDGAPPGQSGGFLLKLDSSGKLLWLRWLGLSGVDYGSIDGMGTDAQGNIYVVGKGATYSAPHPQAQFFVAKLDPSGTRLWAQSFEPNVDLYATVYRLSLAVAPGGGATVVGIDNAPATFGGSLDAGVDVGFVVALDASGQTQYVKAFGASFVGQSAAAAFDPSGNLLVTGQFTGALDLGAPLTAQAPSAAFVAKLSPAGQVQWDLADGTYSSGSAVATTAGGAYVAGTSQGTIGISNAVTVRPAGETFVAGIDPNGLPTFETSFFGGSTVDALAADPTGGVVGIGLMTSSVDNLGDGLLTPPGVWLAKFDDRGNVVYSARFGLARLPGLDYYPSSLALDGSGNVVTAGNFYGAIDLGTGVLAASQPSFETTMFIARYAPRPPPVITPGAACGVPLDGGVPDSGGRLLTTTFGDVALGPGAVYWTTNSEVMSEPLEGGSPALLATEQNPAALAIHSDSLYWLNASGPVANGSIVSIGLDGGSPVTLVGGLAAPQAFAIDDVGIYWTAGGVPVADGGTSAGSVLSAPIDGGTPTLLVSELGKPGPIAVANGVVVYTWLEMTDAGGAGAVASVIASIPRSGGSPTILATSDRNVASVALDATNAYWSESNTQGVDTTFDDGRIWSVPLARGTPTVLTTNLAGPGRLVLLGSSLYWNTLGSWSYTGPAGNAGVWSMSISGGSVTAILSHRQSVRPFAIDAQHVAWGDVLDSINGVDALFVTDR